MRRSGSNFDCFNTRYVCIVDRQLNLELKENYDLIFLILFFSYLRYVMTFDKKEEEENIRKYDDEFLLSELLSLCFLFSKFRNFSTYTGTTYLATIEPKLYLSLDFSTVTEPSSYHRSPKNSDGKIIIKTIERIARVVLF